MKLKEYRQKANLTQPELAEKLNMSTRGYISWETGRTQPNIETLIKLADFFHTTVDSLIDHDVPYLLDKSSLSSTQREIVGLLPHLNEDQSRLVVAYINGLLEGEADRLSFVERMKKNRPF